jgi:hypothetical protein
MATGWRLASTTAACDSTRRLGALIAVALVVGLLALWLRGS